MIKKIIEKNENAVINSKEIMLLLCKENNVELEEMNNVTF